MKHYAKVVSENTKACIVGFGDPDAVFKTEKRIVGVAQDGSYVYEEKTVTVGEYYESLGMSLLDVEEAEDGGWYLEGYAPPPTPDPAADAEAMLNAIQRRSAIRSIPLDDDKTALIVAPVCPGWAAGQEYGKGDILNHGGTVYRVIQDVLSLENQPPGAEGMLAIYRPVVFLHAGTADDPIPFENGMDVENGRYYSLGGKTYLAKADMMPCTWPPGSEGVWQWEEVRSRAPEVEG